MNFKQLTLEDRKHIRLYYDQIMQKLRHGSSIDPYSIAPINWREYMSPIEAFVWADMRSQGAVFYPQVPCGNYFIDFANPHFGIAVEVDGKEFHTDHEKDEERSRYLQANGYPRIIRISGKRAYKLDLNDDYSISYYDDMTLGTTYHF